MVLRRVFWWFLVFVLFCFVFCFIEVCTDVQPFMLTPLLTLENKTKWRGIWLIYHWQFKFNSTYGKFITASSVDDSLQTLSQLLLPHLSTPWPSIEATGRAACTLRGNLHLEKAVTFLWLTPMMCTSHQKSWPVDLTNAGQRARISGACECYSKSLLSLLIMTSRSYRCWTKSSDIWSLWVLLQIITLCINHDQ